jgi:hypothetical protein
MGKCVAKDWPKAFLLGFFMVIVSLSPFGCGGTFRSFPNEGDISGNWTLFLSSSGTQKVLTLAQTGENIAGTTSDGGTITGSVSGSDVSLTINNVGGTTTILAGTASSDWKTMSGTYTSTGSDGSGTWTATKIIPTPTPAPLAVSPTSATLSCSAGTSQVFTVTGGSLSNYSVTSTQNPTLVTLSTTTLTTNGQFTVTANTAACTGASGLIVNLTVADTVSTSVTVPVTVSNP